MISFIFRDYYHSRNNAAEPAVAEISIGKQRNDATENVKLVFLCKYTRFENLTSERRIHG